MYMCIQGHRAYTHTNISTCISKHTRRQHLLRSRERGQIPPPCSNTHVYVIYGMYTARERGQIPPPCSNTPLLVAFEHKGDIYDYKQEHNDSSNDGCPPYAPRKASRNGTKPHIASGDAGIDRGQALIDRGRHWPGQALLEARRNNATNSHVARTKTPDNKPEKKQHASAH